VQGRHPEQTSDAVGAAGAQLGPQTIALATYLNKTIGASMGKTAAIVRTVSGISVTPGGISQALDRVARRGVPTYEALVEEVRRSPVVTADESGWKVAGELQWLWVFVTALITVYRIQPGRGFEEAAAVLGKDFGGVLERDGWAPYRRFTQARHQTCNAHLIRRCDEMLQTAKGGARQIPLIIKRLLKDGLEVRERRNASQLTPAAVEADISGLEQRLDEVLSELEHTHHKGNRRLLKHLAREQNALFTYLREPGVQATNWRAEQAVRPAVVNRKVWGGNRSPAGSHTQEVLTSVLRTAQQQGHNPLPILVDLLRSPTPMVAPLLPAASAPTAPG
jgi:transposase